jgi:L-aspartate oxidase
VGVVSKETLSTNLIQKKPNLIVDYLIVGSGVAGLYASLFIPKEKSSLIVSKRKPWDCNSYYAQGGVATARDEEDIPSHISDTLNAGFGHCNEEVVTKLSQDSIGVIQDLIDRGLEFDRVGERLAFTKEAAHSCERILHADGDATGRVMHKFLSNSSHTPIMESTTVVDLLIKDDVCHGVTVFSDGKFQNIYAHNVILASGGIGSLYQYNTNSRTSCGEIQGLAFEKGIALKDMEMTQFHPTVFIDSKDARKMLLTEALRGEGAYIVDEDGRRFLSDYDEKGELAPRNIVSRAIFDYKKRTGKNVYISFEQFSQRFFQKRFPNICNALEKMGYYMPEDRVPISPAFHYMMGGIETNLDARVKGFVNLFAIGEVAYTGVHGANRLASNSLLEALVFGKQAIETSLAVNFTHQNLTPTEPKEYLMVGRQDQIIKNELRDIMWESAGIMRNKDDLKISLDKIDKFLRQKSGRMLRLRLLSARSIITSAIARERSLGAHYLNESTE